MAERRGLRDDHRMLDLGYGPGQFAMAFAFFAGSVVVIDPEPEMLRIAAGIVEWISPHVEPERGASADLSRQLGRFRMAVTGHSFHWTDRAETLGRLDALIEPAGAVALFEADHPDVPENAWLVGYEALLERHAGDDPVQAARRTSDWVRHEGLLLESPFSRLQRIGVIERRRVSVDRLVDRALSQSSTSRARLGAGADRLAEEILASLAGVAPHGIVTEVVESTALVARRPKPASP